MWHFTSNWGRWYGIMTAIVVLNTCTSTGNVWTNVGSLDWGRLVSFTSSYSAYTVRLISCYMWQTPLEAAFHWRECGASRVPFVGFNSVHDEVFWVVTPCARWSCHITTLCHNQEDHDMNLHSRENLKTHFRFSCFYQLRLGKLIKLMALGFQFHPIRFSCALNRLQKSHSIKILNHCTDEKSALEWQCNRKGVASMFIYCRQKSTVPKLIAPMTSHFSFYSVTYSPYLKTFQVKAVDITKTYYCLSHKVKLFCAFNWAPHHEGVLGEWRYSSTHSWPRV